jgi:GNAT superfamily N-acetyltransferase
MTDPSGYRIRRAESGDATGLAALVRSIGLFRRIKSESAGETLAHLSRNLELALAGASHSIYVADDDAGALVGYVAVHWLPYLILAGPEGFVSELFIDEGSRGKGIGTALLDRVIAEARSRDCRRLQLINFRERESYQRGFYSRLGWVERPDAADFVLTIEG